ncbi:MAG: alpha/beta hydrolase-fold protein [Polyangiaceae bacterium]
MFRRHLLRGLGLTALAAAGCSSPKEAARGALAKGGWRDVQFEPSPDQPDGQRALVLTGAEPPPPIVVALHGRGEAGRGLAAGARGWRDDYALDAMIARFAAGAITRDDVFGWLDAARVETINRSLSARAFRGLAIVTPYCPVPSGSGESAYEPFGRFVTSDLLERARRELGVESSARASTGIDGVSMGGRYALEIGFGFSEVFGAVGALQPAIRESEAERFADLAVAAAKKSGPQSIRLVTSGEDPFLEPTRALARELTSRSIACQLLVTGGPHDYAWNKGPGAAELLVFHERVLRGLPLAE